MQNVIAIDGPSASGKSTLAHRLAARLNIPCVNTGSMFRATALAALPLPDREVILGVGERLAAFRSYSLRVTDRVAGAALSPYFVLN